MVMWISCTVQYDVTQPKRDRGNLSACQNEAKSRMRISLWDVMGEMVGGSQLVPLVRSQAGVAEQFADFPVASSHQDLLQQYGEGCDGKLVQVS